MARTITKDRLDELAKSVSKSKTMSIITGEEQRVYVGGGDGSWNNPFCESVFQQMLNNGTWEGGFVAGRGFVLPELVVYGSSNSSSSSSSSSSSCSSGSSSSSCWNAPCWGVTQWEQGGSSLWQQAADKAAIKFLAGQLPFPSWKIDAAAVTIAMIQDGGVVGDNTFIAATSAGAGAAGKLAGNAAGTWAIAKAGAKKGAKLGTIIGPKGTVVGFVFGFASGLAASQFAKRIANGSF